MKLINIVFLIALFSTTVFGQQSNFKPNTTVPDKSMIAYQQMEIIGFIHFNMNTFTDKEWGFGDESERLFNPKKLDVEQWVKAAKDGGLKELILTAKHHDGFCLWPTKFGEHSVKNSPYKNGKGDIVKEFTEACKKYGIKSGLYLSPWDRNHAQYGKPEYITYYKNQLTELLTNYGEISEVWLDGANGGDGYYGGTREKRFIDSKTYYPFAEIYQIVKKLQPTAKIFSDVGPDIHWIGNESGFAGETFWSTINKDSITFGGASQEKYLNTGDPKGVNWIVGQCDVSIRPGWFYHASENQGVKSPEKLVDLYYKSVGRNALLLLNIPPNTDGLMEVEDVASLKAFKSIIEETFKTNLVKGATVKASNIRGNSPTFGAKLIIDNSSETFWAADDKLDSAYFEIQLPKMTNFDRLLLQEPIAYGQRIAKFYVQAFVNNQWKTIASETTIGLKRLLRFDAVNSNRIRVVLKEYYGAPAISNIGIYKSTPREIETIKPNASIAGDLDKNAWKITTNTPNEKASMIIDGNFFNSWRQTITIPFSMVIDLGKNQTISGFYYEPLKDKQLGNIEKYSIYVSQDGNTWGEPISKGEFANIANNPILQKITFTQKVQGKFVKFTADKIVEDKRDVSFLEFGLY
jgi:alpha-L-fucosidase